MLDSNIIGFKSEKKKTIKGIELGLLFSDLKDNIQVLILNRRT